MIIGLFPNEFKSHSLDIAKDVSKFLKERGTVVVTEDHLAQKIEAEPLSAIDPQKMAFQISLGGDGTILRLVHRLPHLQAPLLGINLGNLGFLADIPLDEIYPSLQELLDGHYTIQARMMMEGVIAGGEKCYAVNEIVVHRSQNASLIDLSISVDGQYVNTFSADGIIISTPSGSTAYSLSAGGPIISPDLDAFVITPICPHTISNRPIVVMPKEEIQVQYLSHHLPVEIYSDGISTFSLSTQQTLNVTTSTKRFPLVHLSHHNYFDTLREKLGWQGRLKTHV